MHTIEEKNIQIIGVDAGYGNIKTANTVFATGITAYDHEPMFGGNVMEYQGKWYRIGEGHKAFNPDKTCDEDFRLLTYAAIAAELAHHEMTSAQVELAAGLPLSWTARHREEFRSYLMENRDIRLRFNDEDYHFTLVGCYVFPQGYSALVPMIHYNQNRFNGTTVMADIGNGTMDTLFMVNGSHASHDLIRPRMCRAPCGAVADSVRDGASPIPQDTIRLLREPKNRRMH